MSDDILDLPDQSPYNPWPERLLYIAVLCCIYWYVAGLVHWPYAMEALAAGCALLLVNTIWTFILRKRKPAYSYGYFFGKLCLIFAVFVHLGKGPYAIFLVLGAAAGFSVGILMLYFRREGSQKSP